MIRLVSRIITENNGISHRFKTTIPSNVAKEKWDLFAGVLVERLPVVSKSLNGLETEYQNLQHQLEFENSLLSDIEVEHKKDVQLAEQVKKGEVQVDIDAVSKQTAQDRMDAWKSERSKFEGASRTTAADTKNDLTALKRSLENTLVLLTEQQLGDKKHFLLPQGKRTEGETLRQTAERVIKTVCGATLNVDFWGNAPCAFYKYRYPKGTDDSDAIGAKVFFFRAIYKNGNVDKKLTKFEWLDKAGALSRLNSHQRYIRSVKTILL